MYFPIESTKETPVVPAKPSRKARPFGSVSRANQPPNMNRTSEAKMNGTAYRRSLDVSPGVMKRQNSYRTTGRARAAPRKNVTFNLIKKGSTMLWKNRSQG